MHLFTSDFLERIYFHFCLSSTTVSTMDSTEQTTSPLFRKIQLAFSFIYVSVCFFGCLYQCIFISKIYLSFEVLTKLRIYLPQVLRSPGVSTCFRYVDILDIDEFNKEYNKSIPLTVDDKIVREIQNTILLDSIFNLTPGGSNHGKINDTKFLLESCFIRSPFGYNLEHMGGSKCSEVVFDMERFIVQEYICYKFVVKSDFLETINPNTSASNVLKKKDPNALGNTDTGEAYDFKRLALSTIFPNVFFTVRVKAQPGYFAKADRMRVVIHSAGDLPFVSLSLSPVLYRKALDLEPQNVKKYLKSDNSTGKPKFILRNMFNHVASRFSRTQIRRLPYPYSTNCRIKYSRNQCITNCSIESSIKIFKKIPFQQVFKELSAKEHGKLKMISVTDVSNSTMNSKIKEIVSSCEKKCKSDSCYVDYSVTSSRLLLTSDKKRLTFEVGCAFEPFTSNESVPSVTLNDYFLQLLSLFGFWLGLSVREINPAVVFIRSKRLMAKMCPCCSGNQQITRHSSSSLEAPVKVIDDNEFCIKTRQQITVKLNDSFISALNLAAKKGLISYSRFDGNRSGQFSPSESSRVMS